MVSLTQSTELGTLYTPDEIATLCDTAHRLGMSVHVDGARIANAVAALGGTVAALRSLTVDAGVDVLSFGGTKNGLLGGEAVVYLNPELATSARYVRKQVTQLASKMRFVAAQFNALLDDGSVDRAGDPRQRHGRRSSTAALPPSTRSSSARRRVSTACSRVSRRRRSNRCVSGVSSGIGTSAVTRCGG